MLWLVIATLIWCFLSLIYEFYKHVNNKILLCVRSSVMFSEAAFLGAVISFSCYLMLHKLEQWQQRVEKIFTLLDSFAPNPYQCASMYKCNRLEVFWSDPCYRKKSMQSHVVARKLEEPHRLHTGFAILFHNVIGKCWLKACSLVVFKQRLGGRAGWIAMGGANFYS